MKRLFVLLLLLLFIFNTGYCQSTYPPNDRANHNRVNTRKNLLQKYTLDQLSAMIASGNFDDIYVGDYIEMEMTTVISGNNVTEKVRWLVGAIDYFYNRTDSAITTHHIVLVAEDGFITQHRMNSSNTTTGGFAGSEMYTATLPLYDTAITNAFGSSHILSYHQLLTTSMSSTIPSMAGNNYSGASNGWAWANGSGTNPHITKLCLMSEPQLFGTKVCSSSFYDIGINNSQFPLFAQMPEKIKAGRGIDKSATKAQAFFLLNIVSSTYFGNCNGYGASQFSGGGNTFSLRPYFLFY